MRVILASTSESKQHILKKAGIDIEAMPANYKEDMSLAIPPEELALTLALGKARSVAKDHPDAVIIGTDVFSIHKERVVQAPTSIEEVKRQLLSYRGETLMVVCGLAVLKGEQHFTHVEKAWVRFRSDIKAEEIDAYIATGIPVQSSGAFTHDDIGSSLIENFEGDHTSVMGLPLFKTLAFLRMFGVNPLCRP